MHVPPHDIIVIEWTFTRNWCVCAIWGRNAPSPPSSRCAAPSPVMRAPNFWFGEDAGEDRIGIAQVEGEEIGDVPAVGGLARELEMLAVAGTGENRPPMLAQRGVRH